MKLQKRHKQKELEVLALREWNTQKELLLCLIKKFQKKIMIKSLEN